jgi:anti-anti-sigma regulatory factor
MPGCRIVRETEGDRAVIRVAGVFDRPSAIELNERLGRERSGDVVLDFSLVREFADLGVAALAQGLAVADRRVSLRGLRRHQLRIFRYFGVDPEPARGVPSL